VTPRAMIRAVITTGWLTGITLILAGLPLWAALAVPAAVTAFPVTWTRLGGRHVARRAAEAMRLRRPARTGGAVERA